MTLLDGLPAAAELAPEGTGVIGNRHLVAVQTIDIARLTANPVPIVPGTFNVVTGQGPKGDSNGSGKTSFESVVALLLGDAQWRLEGNGSAAAAGLLFKPESAGLAPEHRYAAADRGYVIGVFADPAAPEQTSITVWLRIAVSTPYLRARWTHGIHVAVGDNDVERFAEVDRLWEALPRGAELGPQKLARTLYGDAPRCMAYLDTSLRKTGPSLLSQQMTELEPDRIGEALIELTGRASLLEREEQQRGTLAAQKQVLTQRERDDAQQRLEEQTILDAVYQRKQAREHLAGGDESWRMHFAQGLIENTARDRGLAAQVEQLVGEAAAATADWNAAKADLDALLAITDPQEQASAAEDESRLADERYDAAQLAHHTLRARHDNLTRRRNELTVAADGWTGASVEHAHAEHDRLTGVHDSTRADLKTADAAVQAATDQLADVSAGRGGEAGRAVAVLADAGIDAAPVLDAIRIDQDARRVWEPRLWPYRHAVAVSQVDEPAAAAALSAAGVVGATLIPADGALDGPVAGLPVGLTADLPIGGFLAAVADTHDTLTAPDRARNVFLGDVVLGGFATDIAGLTARIAAAEQQLAHAGDQFAAATQAETNARLAAEQGRRLLAAAEAADELARVVEDLQQLDRELADSAPELARLRSERERLLQARVTALAAAQTQEQLIQLAESRLGTTTTALKAARDKLNERRTERAQLDLEYWLTGWGDAVDTATATIAALPGAPVTARTFRSRAAEALNAALTAYTPHSGGELPPELADAHERRRRFSDEDTRDGGREMLSFTYTAQPLRDLLNAHLDSDLVLEERIERDQRTRANEIQAGRNDTDARETELTQLQDAVSNRVETVLTRISDAFDRLNRSRSGFGADLKIVGTRPVTPTAPWKWDVTPRWRRSPSGDMVSYKASANAAQVKVIAIQLVLAALLAHDGAQGRVLILDELGNSLGDVNRKEVLSSLHEVAQQQNITILGTCQDSVLPDAAGMCGAILWFSHHSHNDAFNQPTRVWAFDDNQDRVQLTREWLTAGRGLV